MLESLVRYAERERLLEDATSRVGPVDAALRIRRDGTFVSITPLSVPAEKGKARRGEMRVPGSAGQRTRNVLSEFLVDKCLYVFATEEAARPFSRQCGEAYRSLLDRAVKDTSDDALRALSLFLATEDNRAAASAQLHAAMGDKEVNLGHVIVPFLDEDIDQPMHARPAVQSWWAGELSAAEGALRTGRCLVTGTYGPIARLHDSVKGVGSDAAPLVSFNCSAHSTLGKEQGANAPIGAYAANAYVRALNHLLARKANGQPRSGVRHDDAVTVFWTDENEPLLGLLAALFAADGESAKLVATSPWKGLRAARPATRFYGATLSLNVARIVVRGWFTTTAGEVFDAVGRWFEDIRLIGIDDGRPLPLRWLVSALQAAPGATGDKRGLSTELEGRLFQLVLLGQPLPRSVLSTAVERVRVPADKQDTHDNAFARRVALIKASLRRDCRAGQLTDFPEITVALDETNQHPAYVLGRLFSVLEQMQLAASGRERELNATIRDRYFGAACRTPAIAFARLIQLSVHHAAKLDTPWLEKRKGQILSLLGAAMPATLTLEEQGLFAIGYYHEREHRFRRRVEADGDATTGTTTAAEPESGEES